MYEGAQSPLRLNRFGFDLSMRRFLETSSLSASCRCSRFRELEQLRPTRQRCNSPSPENARRRSMHSASRGRSSSGRGCDQLGPSPPSRRRFLLSDRRRRGSRSGSSSGDRLRFAWRPRKKGPSVTRTSSSGSRALKKSLKQKRLPVHDINFRYKMSGNVMICQVLRVISLVLGLSRFVHFYSVFVFNDFDVRPPGGRVSDSVVAALRGILCICLR